MSSEQANFSGVSFRSPLANRLSEKELGGLRYRLGAARRDALDLQRKVDRWRDRTDLRSEVRQDPEDRRVFEHTITSSEPFPSPRWSFLAGRTINESRSVLDNFNTLMFERFAQSAYDPDRIYFPITTTGKEWRSWRQKHTALPRWVVDRYKGIQPSEGPFKGLIGLKHLDNDRKHKRSTPVSIAFHGQLWSGNFPADALSPSIEALSNVLQPGMRSVKVSRVTCQREVLDFSIDENVADPEFDVLFGFKGEAYELPELAELPNRVSHAIDYVSTGDPAALHKYMARPDFLVPCAGHGDDPLSTTRAQAGA